MASPRASQNDQETIKEVVQTSVDLLTEQIRDGFRNLRLVLDVEAATDATAQPSSIHSVAQASRIRELEENVRNLETQLSLGAANNTTESEELLPDKIIKMYKDLLHDIQKYARRFYRNYSNQPVATSSDPQPDFFTDIFRAWGKGLGERALMNRTRFLIFRILYEAFFSMPYFETEHIDFKVSKPYFVHDVKYDFSSKDGERQPRSVVVPPWLAVKAGLEIFEQEFRGCVKNKRDRDDRLLYQASLSQWREQTMRLVTHLGLSSFPANASEHVREACTDIKELLQPILTNHDDPQQLHAQTMALCESASKFTLTLRRAKQRYQIELPRLQEPFREENHNLWTVENVTAVHQQPKEVLFPVTGLLATVAASGKRQVLVQAYVVGDGSKI
ncbi:hypothetical protein BJ875DRAFT_512874 [Amylocarpus encephaloides]|uniref:Uncharacterized protein n=1 Tax=Amylocarpus encephaloides TaxID=45428 RepID=A0A9P7YGT0_9HELO|nr:hypothetical protein BJ875DRAFT_512874 [Amylocarpus encephaloides]